MRARSRIFRSGIFFCLSSAVAFGQGSVLVVDVAGGPGSQFPQIQPALDAAQSGDTILVRDGIYTGSANKNLNFGGKILELRSENGPQNCIIDPEWDGRGITFHSGETAQARVQGFTIRHAGVAPIYINDGGIPYQVTDGAGGGIVCYNSSPTFENCIVRDCLVQGYEEDPASGAGVFLHNSHSVFLNCKIVGNLATCLGGAAFGGGILSELGNPQFLNCLIADNSAQNFGGGISLTLSNLILRNCTIVNNAAGDDAGGGIHVNFSNVLVRNSIFRGNKTYNSSGPVANQVELVYGLLDIAHSDLQGGAAAITGQNPNLAWGPGNFDLDPQFVAPSSGDYRLLPGSPCIDAGDNAQAPAGLLVDLDGSPRGVDDPQVCDTGSGEVPVVDLGAYEFLPAPGPWKNLGGALAGSIGKPCLVGTGNLIVGNPTLLQLSGAASSASAFLVMGLMPLNLPFQGGILIPQPDRVVKLMSDASGELSLGGAWPALLPSGTTLYFQYWITDGSGPMGFTASNALRATLP